MQALRIRICGSLTHSWHFAQQKRPVTKFTGRCILGTGWTIIQTLACWHDWRSHCAWQAHALTNLFNRIFSIAKYSQDIWAWVARVFPKPCAPKPRLWRQTPPISPHLAWPHKTCRVLVLRFWHTDSLNSLHNKKVTVFANTGSYSIYKYLNQIYITKRNIKFIFLNCFIIFKFSCWWHMPWMWSGLSSTLLCVL